MCDGPDYGYGEQRAVDEDTDDVASLYEDYVPCTDGGDDDHYRALVHHGACPYCGLTEAEARVDAPPFVEAPENARARRASLEHNLRHLPPNDNRDLNIKTRQCSLEAAMYCVLCNWPDEPCRGLMA